ncbi:hypothetical protein [Defluviitalea phaphyphila]|uniref:hypothetical protein n=1 Tax=Defluviitalea phaphyphila TaxID=1473580 RepID=UPI0007304C4F|nr:hypothetical protein [Defluviitalea phaphyphila]
MYFNQPFSYQEQIVPPPFVHMPIQNFYMMQDYKSAELIEEAAKRERILAIYDNKIMESFEDELDRKRIYKISLNQIRHQKMLEEIYRGMTRKKLSINIKEPDCDDNLKSNLDRRIFEGFECIELYRKIYFFIVPMEWKQMMYEIISDEQNDILKYIYYFNKVDRH